MEFISLLILVFASITCFISLLFLLEVMAALPYYWQKNSGSVNSIDRESSQSTAFLIPAHNEEAVIADTLNSIVPQLGAGDEIVVVADNCTDKTADIVASKGFTVLERFDHHRRGKGYALDFGLNYIKAKAFDVVIIVDADCLLAAGARDKLVAQVLAKAKPVQALYLMKSPSHKTDVQHKIAEFAWHVKNKLRPLGLKAMGGPCQLTGTGMAFPISTLDGIQLASASVVEDMQLGLDLSIAGHPPELLATAVVSSEFPSDETVGDGQRSRWIHGHLGMIFSYAPRLLLSALVKRDGSSMLMALDLIILPLVMLLVINFFSLVLVFVDFLLLDSKAWIVGLLSIASFSVALMTAWLLEGRHILSFKDFIYGGLIFIKKISVFLTFFTNRRRDWNKTARK